MRQETAVASTMVSYTMTNRESRTSMLRPSRPLFRMAGAVAMAWLGMYIHNRADLPNLSLWSPENAVPGLVWLFLFGLWWAMPDRMVPDRLLLGWGLLNLVGGFATVLPVRFLPFKPEQSLRHYTFHLLYALTQLPLLVLIRNELRHLRSRSDGSPDQRMKLEVSPTTSRIDDHTARS